MSEMFDAVDALVAGHASLPPPVERLRLRKAHGLTLDQVAGALKVRRATVGAWESGKTEPRPPHREAYARLLEKLTGLYPSDRVAAPTDAGGQSTVPAPVAKRSATPVRPAKTAGPSSTSRRPAAKKATPKPTRAPATAAAADDRFVNGPFAVVDGDGTAYGVGGLVLDCPAGDLPGLVDWALNDVALGAARLHRHGQDADPLLVLTAAATEAFGLPHRLTDRRGLRLPEDHPVVKELAGAGWQLTRRGFGPWPRIYRPADGGRRQCVQLAVLPWDALDERAWGPTADLPSAELARVLGNYATRVITPRGSAAVCGLELMTALRPPTRAVRDNDSGDWVSGQVSSSLTEAVDPAPPEAPDEHPILDGVSPRGHVRGPDEVLDEEAYEWIREPQLLTDDECTQPYAVGLDVNAAFLAATNRLTVGLSEPVHLQRPAFDKKTPGSWLVDLSHIELDPRLPSPFTPTGHAPKGPAWYATPTLAYAVELGYDVHPLEAYVRLEAGPYLDPWHARLRDAYLATMADLGVTKDLDDEAFLAAMERHKAVDPGQAAVLSAIKATVKGGLGKLRERPQGAGYRPGQPWPALHRATWRPDIRAAVIAQARTNMHRKMLRMATTAGLYPLAVLSDCVVYPSAGPSPLDFLPRTEEGKPAPGCFRLGVSPGMVKLEGARPLLWAAELLDQGHNPARHIKDTAVPADQGE
ncbi:helix-turn-helix domain-containing protein [Streptomyces sp. DSM 42041]|uniref:Helix-turn-helix domain-containing protein n=1 Tax=Streptomyces hazeniae TaxID=3075538 RepID=A0ABU2NZM6_9ACTN|nr:helix-turn-helix domain-containing protein [Streptomyces sp. DSM 42041]MDT0382439.1 helix-turn-helix domain-containing protein [Streptomyces sp. DSM 42041]